MKICLMMGFFDSVHIGHRQLISKAKEYALTHGMIAAVYTFCNDIGKFFGSQQLYSFAEREFLLKDAGAELIISDIFSEKLKNMSGKDFLISLISRYDIGAFFCGYDYTFGFGGRNNAEDLLAYATHNNIDCVIMPPFVMDGVRVSTTCIKELLSLGEVERANKLLGTPYFMSGKVVHGRGVGAGFGYPTANVDHSGFLPKEGVYKTVATVDGTEYISITNVGAKPTFGVASKSVESFIIDFDGDLYGKEITLQFIKYLRPIKKFRDGNELNEQIIKDTKEALC